MFDLNFLSQLLSQPGMSGAGQNRGLFGDNFGGFMQPPQQDYMGLFQQQNPAYGNPLTPQPMPQNPYLSEFGTDPKAMWAGFTSDRTPNYVPVDQATSIDQVAPGDQNQWLFNYLSGGE